MSLKSNLKSASHFFLPMRYQPALQSDEQSAIEREPFSPGILTDPLKWESPFQIFEHTLSPHPQI